MKKRGRIQRRALTVAVAALLLLGVGFVASADKGDRADGEAGLPAFGSEAWVEAFGPAIPFDQVIRIKPYYLTTEQQLALPPDPEHRKESTRKRLRPTMFSDAEYAALKERLNAERRLPGQRKPGVPRLPSPAAPPSVRLKNWQGDSQSEGLRPPDTHAAVGNRQVIEVTNSQINIYDKVTGVAAITMTLNQFMGYTGAGSTTVFDPRVIFDDHWNKWVVTGEAFPEDPNVGPQFHFIAISKSRGNALKGWHIYRLNVFRPGVGQYFFDYPQLGFDQDALLITANSFNPGFLGAELLILAKAPMYRGRPVIVFRAFNLEGSLTPTVSNPAYISPGFAADQNVNTYLLANSNFANHRKYTVTNSSRNPPSLSGPVNIPLPAAWSVPPDADQPGLPASLDTLDGRFNNVGTQTNGKLFYAHGETTAGGNFPTCTWYEINPVTNTVITSGSWWATDFSDDFMCAIVANHMEDVFVTWSHTETIANGGVDRFASVAGWGKQSGDPSITLNCDPTCTAITSGGAYTGFRWGDYSSVVIDPKDLDSAWTCTEYAIGPNNWSSRITHITFP